MSERSPPVIVLLRGINVGGKGRLPMDELAQILRELGLEDVETYIQSGNAVGRMVGAPSPTLGEDIASAVQERRGFRPQVLVLAVDRLHEAIEANPFPEAAAEPKSLHLLFLAREPSSPDMESLMRVASASERFRLAGDVFYLHAPAGIGRSKLASSVERHLGVAATGRNWRTVQKLREMAEALP